MSLAAIRGVFSLALFTLFDTSLHALDFGEGDDIAEVQNHLRRVTIAPDFIEAEDLNAPPVLNAEDPHSTIESESFFMSKLKSYLDKAAFT